MITYTSTSMRSLHRLALLLVLGGCTGAPDGEDSPDAAVASTPDASAQDTWASYAEGFFEVYCHNCHGPGDALRDYSIQASVVGEQDKIRCGVSPVAIAGCAIPARQFPIGNGAMPNDTERSRLVRWIEQGAP